MYKAKDFIRAGLTFLGLFGALTTLMILNGLHYAGQL